jgi:hypothetical protein
MTHQWSESSDDVIPFHHFPQFSLDKAERIIETKLFKDEKLPQHTKVYFYRHVKNAADNITRSAMAVLPASMRVHEPTTYLFVCVQKVSNAGRPTDAASMFVLGFIHSSAPEVQMASEVDPGMLMHNVELTETSYIIPCAALSRKPQVERNIAWDEEYFCTQTMKDAPDSWVYIMSPNPPGSGEKELKNVDVADVAWTRLRVLIKLYNDRQKKSMVPYQLKVLPIQNKSAMNRDRCAMHLLALAMCSDADLIDFYVEAETVALSNNLTQLKDYDDKVLTLLNNGLRFEHGSIDLWNSLDSRIIEHARITLMLILLHGAEYMKNVQVDEEDVDFFELLRKLREYAAAHIEFQSE